MNTASSNRRRRYVVGVAAVLIAGVVALASLTSTRAPAAREIVLTARNMAFYLEGDVTPNPTLPVRAGESVTIVLRSDDPGITHDFTVTSWKVATPLLTGKGAVSVSFRVPDAPGTSQEYVCAAHSLMMRGTISIRP